MTLLQYNDTVAFNVIRYLIGENVVGTASFDMLLTYIYMKRSLAGREMIFC